MKNHMTICPGSMQILTLPTACVIQLVLNSKISTTHDNAHPHAVHRVQEQLATGGAPTSCIWPGLMPIWFSHFYTMNKKYSNSSWTTTYKKLWYSGLGSTPRNPLQMGYVSLCLNRALLNACGDFLSLLQHLHLWASMNGFQLYVPHTKVLP